MAARTAAHAHATAAPLGRLFPAVPAVVAREADGFLLISGSGMQSRIRGPICDDIEASLRAGGATPGLRRLAPAHAALAELTAWLATPAVPLTRYDAVRLDGFDTLFVELLGRCNERCVHCYADAAPTVEEALDREVVFSVIDQAVAAGFRRIQFTGGDPLLCDFLPEAVARARAAGIPHIEIFTNGLALTDELLAELAPHAPAFAFSFYSLDPEAHDRMTRTPGSHRRTLAAIDRVVARGLTSRAAVVVLEPGGDVQALVEFLRARGVGFVSWTRTFSVGRGVEIADASRAAVEAAEPPAAAPAATGTASSPRLEEGGGHSAPGPRLGRGKLCITYTGDVVPCIFQRQSVLGNVSSGRPLVDIIAGVDLAGVDQAPARRGLPIAAEARQRLQCASCRLTDVALGWLGGTR